jgi:hypothetical protein
MTKNVEDLINQNVLLLARIPEYSYTMPAVPNVIPEVKREVHHSHTSGGREEAESHPRVIADNRDENQEGESDREDPEKAHHRKEEEKLRDVLSKLEQRCDLLSEEIHQRDKGKTSLVDNLLQKQLHHLPTRWAVIVSQKSSRSLILQSIPDLKIRSSTLKTTNHI